MDENRQSLEKSADVKLKFRENLSYGFGCVGIIIPFHLVMGFLNYYWTDVLLLPAAAVGTFMMVNKFWDAINDPIVGTLADRTHTKSGRYRPWLVSAVPVTVLAFFLFFKIPGLSLAAQMAFTFIVYFAYVLSMTCLEVPHVSLMSTMTTNYKARGTLASFRQASASVMMLLLTATFLPLCMKLGNGDQAQGFTPTVAIFLAISIPFYVLCFAGVREKVIPAEKTEEKIPVRENFKALKGNVPAIMLCVAYFTWGVGGGISAGSRMYYFQYVAGDINLFTLNMSIMTAGGTIAAFALGTLNVVIKNKRNIGMICWIVSGITYMIQFAMGDSVGDNMGVFNVLTFIIGLFGQIGFVCILSLVPDITEYTQVKHGLRASGFLFAIINFCYKVGMSVATGVFSWILAAQHYVPGDAQPDNIKFTMIVAITLAPGICTFCGVVAFLFYKLNKDTHEAALKAIDDIKK